MDTKKAVKAGLAELTTEHEQGIAITTGYSGSPKKPAPTEPCVGRRAARDGNGGAKLQLQRSSVVLK
jgi:hypothetical protein